MDVPTFNRIQRLAKVENEDVFTRLGKTMEELGELAGAMLGVAQVQHTAYKGKTREDVVEELADTLITSMSIAEKYAITRDELIGMMNFKCNKWERLIEEQSNGTGNC
ncbi:MAG TPA: MazG-like family protein [Candidatus Didemnitutus sp.]|nr:MazG-like family protein [Candidatus Didemnitutus sp.]